MATFDFITNEEFRQSLENDHTEMERCLSAEAWKAVHVLAGSIVEAVLVECIVAEGYLARDAALKLDLAGAIDLCKKHKAISDRTADLSSVVRGYRNLVHPGRVIRNSDQVSRDSAAVAKALVNLVVAEVEKQRQRNYGYTAEQIVTKLRNDAMAEAIIPHLIREARAIEIERLLVHVLPGTYRELEDSFREIPPAYSACFRSAFDVADQNLKGKVARQFAKIVRESDEHYVSYYGLSFFRATDLAWLESGDCDVVKKYLLSCLERDALAWLGTLAGIGGMIDLPEVDLLVDTLVRYVVSHQDAGGRQAQAALVDECQVMSTECNNRAMRRLDAWINTYNGREQSAKAAVVAKLKETIEANFLPF